MQQSRVSHRVRVSRRAFPLAAGLLVVAASIPFSGVALAQGPPPTYPDRLISLPGAELRQFAQWLVSPVLVVPTAKLQAVLDAQAGGPGLFVPLGEGGMSQVYPGASIELIRESGGSTLPPASSLYVLVLAFNVPLGRLEAVQIGLWDSDAAGFNALVGSRVATPAKFESEVEQEGEKQVLKVKVRGADGLRAQLRGRITRGVGVHTRDDPGFLTFRHLTDGPGGVHPTYHIASQADAFNAEAAEFDSGGVLPLRGGDLPILAVQPGSVVRGFEVVIDQD